MNKFLFYFAVTGWALVLLVHILSLIDFDVTEQFPYVWLLGIGIFVVWLAAILKLKKNKKLKELKNADFRKRLNPLSSFKIFFENTPTWLTVIAIGGFFYAGINFFLFLHSVPGQAEIIGGLHVLQSHGHIIKTLTEQEYHHYQALTVRGFSGHWLAFYGIAAAILYPYPKSVSPLVQD